jgi:predicted ATPase/DNA-binding SARP family transcriptional activator
VRFGVLGPLEVTTADGDPVAVGGPRPRALVVLLALNAGRTVGVDALVAGQYGDDPPAGAANAVQAHVSRVRKALPGLVEFHGDGYRLLVDPEDVDAHRFERLATAGRRMLTAGQPAEAAATLDEALGLWRGAPLVDLPHGQAQAARLAELRLTAVEDRAEAALALPDRSPVAELRALVDEHPLRERARALLMRALQAAGRPAEALTEFDTARRLLADELGADPSAELAAAHQAVLHATETPAPRRVPAPLTTFVGRERELAQLAELVPRPGGYGTILDGPASAGPARSRCRKAQVQPGTRTFRRLASEHLDPPITTPIHLDGALAGARLVTVHGPGGTGKTRLAVEFARRHRTACFVDLSTVDSGVAAVVLAALGSRDTGFGFGQADPVRRLVAALAGEMLLVLDNCEQVIDEVADVAGTVLAECPDVRVLATSREPLRLTGETLLSLAPLDDPAAVRLFGERAAAVRPGFRVDDGNRAAVAEICAALDGIPLAIELAAARLRQFSAGEIAARLRAEEHVRLLSRGDRTTRRHRTLAATVAWSWDLLGAEERALAMRFAVFAGGAPVPAIAAVCDADEDVLADLVDKSIVDTDGTRYRMLSVVRLFCAERLAESGTEADARRRHAEYHLDLACRADPHLRGAEQLDWLATLGAEHDNLMAALRWAAVRDRPLAMRLVAALGAYWWLSGRRTAAGATAAALLDGLTAVPAGLDEEYVSCVVHAMPRAADEHWDRAAAALRARDTPLRHPFGTVLWGMAAGPPAHPDDAAPLGDDPWAAAIGRLSVGLLAVTGGRPTAGERALTDVLAEFRALGERWGTAQALDWLAVVSSWRGEWARAEELWAEALALFDELGASEECVDLLCHRGNSRIRQHPPAGGDTAAADFRQAVALAARAGYPDPPPAARLGLAEVARLRGDADTARALLTEADPTPEVHTALGRLAETTGSAEEAARWHARALSQTARLARDVADALDGQAGAALARGDADRAALLLGAAVAVRGMAVTGDPDVARVAAAARTTLGSDAFASTYAKGAALPQPAARALLNESDM